MALCHQGLAKHSLRENAAQSIRSEWPTGEPCTLLMIAARSRRPSDVLTSECPDSCAMTSRTASQTAGA